MTRTPAEHGLVDTPQALAGHVAMARAPHVAALNDLAAAIARAHGAAPWFDPLDGGAEASILLLLETPGPRGGAPRFVSQDNPTATARNLRRFLGAAGIARGDLVIWNAVPWIIHAEGARNRAPTRAELAEGRRWLAPLLARLPRLKAAVLAGRFARACRADLEALAPGLALFEMPHPSPVYVNTRPDIAAGIVAVLSQARAASRSGEPS